MNVKKEHTEITKQLMDLLNGDRELKALVQKSIDLAAAENPDEVKNPVRNLDMLYDYIDFTQTVMPWAYLPEECFKNFVTKTDQSCLYIYYLLDRPLPELEGSFCRRFITGSRITITRFRSTWTRKRPGKKNIIRICTMIPPGIWTWGGSRTKATGILSISFSPDA